MKGLLLFLAGLLVGANVVYFSMRGPVAHRSAPASSASIPAATAVQPAPQPARAATTTATPAADADPAAPASPAATAATATVPAANSDAAAGPPLPPLLVPVRGVAASQLHDTFVEARSGDAAHAPHVHDALDIMAPRGTPVLAAVDGTVEKLFESVPGGLTIYEFDRERTHAYYYAHLDRYAAGLAEGQALRQGDVIGYVGSTGNAAEDAPHLHFAIFVLGPEKRWWQGTAIDPYPLLAGTAASR
jgi:murein DD-endopeptidase MepM/ murein hydrolase activator NlpD